MNVDAIVRQLDSLIEKYTYAGLALSDRQESSFRASAMAAIDRLAPSDSAYHREREAILQAPYELDRAKLDRLMGVVDSLREAYSVGAMSPIQDLIRAEVFDDFLEMAEHLLESDYKDPAAVLIGGVLEQHLRKLCIKATILTTTPDGKPKRAEAINGELASKAVYNKLDQKSVTAWLDLRNKAAHAEYGAYTVEQVRTMLFGVRDFVSRIG